MFIIVDKRGIKVSRHIFHNYEQARTFIIISQRYDWDIVKLKK